MLITEGSRHHFHFTPVSTAPIDHQSPPESMLYISNYVIHSSAPSIIHIIVHCIVEHRFPAEQIGLICIKRALAESLSGKWAGNLIKPLLLGNLIKPLYSGERDQTTTLGNLIRLLPLEREPDQATTPGSLIKSLSRGNLIKP